MKKIVMISILGSLLASSISLADSPTFQQGSLQFFAAHIEGSVEMTTFEYDNNSPSVKGDVTLSESEWSAIEPALGGAGFVVLDEMPPATVASVSSTLAFYAAHITSNAVRVTAYRYTEGQSPVVQGHFSLRLTQWQAIEPALQAAGFKTSNGEPMPIVIGRGLAKPN
jgi:hypothetical protein